MPKFFIKGLPENPQAVKVSHVIIKVSTMGFITGINALVKQPGKELTVLRLAQTLLAYIKADIEYRGSIFADKDERADIAACLKKAISYIEKARLTDCPDHWRSAVEAVETFESMS